MKNFASITTLYVSNAIGYDDNSGIHYENTPHGDGPVKTLTRAIKFVSAMRCSGYNQPVTIKIMDEEYTLDAPIDIRQFDDSYLFKGNNKVLDLTIESFDNNKKTLISGGRRLTGFKPDKFNGIDCLSVEIPEVREGKWTFNDLYVDGIPANHTRYPEEGFFLPEDVEFNAPEGQTRTFSKWFIAKEGDIPETITDFIGSTIRFSHLWLSEILQVEDYDYKTRKCTFNGRTRFSITSRPNSMYSMYYYVENVACGFTKKGQWYLDKENGKLYYNPLDGQTAESIVVYAPVLETLVEVNGLLDGGKTTGINFRNLAFAYTKSDHQAYFKRLDAQGVEVEKIPVGVDIQAAVSLRGAINFHSSSNCSIEDCELYCLGTYGVKAYRNSDHITVRNTVIHDCMGGGVSIGEDDDGDNVHDVTVKNCHLYNLGLRHYSAIGVLLLKVYDCTVENNDIHDLEYSGVSLGWSWGFRETCVSNIRICYNHIYNIGKGNLSDMGGIYIVGKSKGTVVANNLVHDVKGRDYGAIGLYADEGCTGVIWENNIVYNAKDCWHVHYGAFNTIRNNIFAYPEQGAITMGKAIPHMQYIAENNVMLLSGDAAAYRGWSGEDRMPNSTSMFADYNLIYNQDGNGPWYAVGLSGRKVDFDEGSKESGFDIHSIFADPMFKDSKNHDFTLDENSPAFKIGFKPIDVSKIGYKK